MTDTTASPGPATAAVEPAAPVGAPASACRDPRGTYPECPLCGSVEGWMPEHAHFRCRACGFRDSCCD